MTDTSIDTADKHQMQKLAIAAIGLAKSEYTDEDFEKLHIPSVQQYVMLICECVPIDYLTDKTLMRHAVDALINESSVEETVMHVFILYIFRLSAEGSNHPLERGIIRQKIIGLLPRFEIAINKGLIRPDVYDRNADALSHIADSTGEVPEILEALSQEYIRLQK